MIHGLIPPRTVRLAALAAFACQCGAGNAQNLSMMVTDPDPLGLGSFVPSLAELDGGLTGKIKGGFAYGAGLNAEYNSNFFLTEKNKEDELCATFAPWLMYYSDPEGGAAISLNATYRPIMRAYADHSDLNGIDQTGDFTVILKGSRTEIDLFGNYQEVSGTDQLTGEFIEGLVANGGIRVARQIAPRTGLNAGWTAAVSDYGSSKSEGAEVYTAYVGGMWSATERLKIGPTLRYTLSQSDNTGTRDAWALMMDARFQVGERIWLSASFGPEYAVNSGNGNDDSSLALAGVLEAAYVIDERWSWRTSIRSSTVPSPSETNYLLNEVLASTSLRRKLLRGVVDGGLDMRFSEYENIGPVTTSRSNERNLSAFVAYRHGFMHDRAEFASMLRYNLNRGDNDWSQFLLSVGVNVTF